MHFARFLRTMNNCIPFFTLWFVFGSPSLTENQTVGSPGNENVNVCTCLCGNDTRKHKISVYTKLPYKEVAFILHIWCLLN